MRRSKLGLRPPGIKPRQRRRTRHEAQPLQEYALRQGAIYHRPRATPRGAKGREIDMGGDINRTSGA